MKLAFSTLGCPDWNLAQIASAATQFGYDAVELRALGGSINLLERPEFQPQAVPKTRAFLQERGLSICCLDTSCSLDSTDDKARRENVAVAARHGELAFALGAPLI